MEGRDSRQECVARKRGESPTWTRRGTGGQRFAWRICNRHGGADQSKIKFDFIFAFVSFASCLLHHSWTSNSALELGLGEEFGRGGRVHPPGTAKVEQGTCPFFSRAKCLLIAGRRFRATI